ncbi:MULTISPECIES: methyltransferase domain-containing protein [Chroococcidiopsis]|jgi:hypothetical protein|uniref:Methyltransferase type 11 n=1 Tax=Chroococcidiopsis thermalis (strain PCC 7203) TaxID=251229 RepID=K9U6Y0_CHRTP|nr:MULTISPECIES: methyltransferase domain-containing protein [Chroococcidiopsis]AFY90009.1 Methyltransferase type 11 [Chroococcidiopsis thermalis PCC 7203]URD49408.1 class I SAM-dependent methyltransferase [Chroococcidiopsis sp. CCNUC1]
MIHNSKHDFIKYLPHTIAKGLVPYGIYNFLKKGRTSSYTNLLNSYHKSQKIPFSPGYQEAKLEFIQSTISSKELFSCFVHQIFLPEGFGAFFDERVVEYPWIFANLNYNQNSKLLDVGPALNYKFCLDRLLSSNPNQEITMLSLTPDARCFYHNKVSYVLGDVRSLPFINNYFEQITCISTIEHVGMNNQRYGATVEHNPEDYIVALLEMKRVLKNSGALLITVPFGTYEDFGWFQQFDETMVNRIVEAFVPTEHSITYYKYTDKGWNLCSSDLCSSIRYNTHRSNDPLFYTSNPVCAGAVACIKLIK